MDGKSELVQCPRCSSKVDARNLQKHLKRVHSPEAERDIARKKAILAAALVADGKATRPADKMVKCPVCKGAVNVKNLAKHARTKHGLVISSASAKSGVEPANRFRSAREREAFFRTRLGPDIDEESEDAFDRGKILHGGAFELGKGRKH